MNVTYIGYDFFSPVLQYLAGRPDVRINRVVTSDQPWGEHVRRVATAHDIPLFFPRARKADIERFASNSDLVLCAAYDYRLAVPSDTACTFLNLHPTVLPLGRGPAPVQWTLLEDPASAGISLHLMTAAFDAGPIVRQTPLSSIASCSFEVYVHRINQAAVALLRGINAESLRHLVPWPQDEATATHHPIMPEHKRTILPTQTIGQISRLIAAMGPLGACVTIDGTNYLATRVEGVPSDDTERGSPFVNWFYGYYPCADGYCLFPRADLKAV
jgi:methionyl-tRNA formyltransferase